MEIKKNSLASGEKNKKRTELIKNEINSFLINYFNYLVFCLSLIIIAVGLFLLIYPKYQQIYKENEEAKNNLQTEYDAKLDYLNYISSLKESYQSIGGGDKLKIAKIVPAERDVGAIITEIESIVARNSAILTSIKIEPIAAVNRTNLKAESRTEKEVPAGIFNQPPKGIGLIKIAVNLSSVSYPVLKNIIKAFENNLKLFDIAKINFNVSANEAILNIYSYYLPR